MRLPDSRSHLAGGRRTLALFVAFAGLVGGLALWGSRSVATEESSADKPKEEKEKTEPKQEVEAKDKTEAKPEADAKDKAKAEKDAWEAPADAQKQANPIAADAESISRGEKIYTKTCASCHGATGKGDGKSAKILAKKPADLRDDVPHHSDGDLFWKITEGKKPMPSFKKDLKPEQRWDVVNYLRKLTAAEAAGDSAKKAATPPQEPKVMPEGTGQSHSHESHGGY